MKYINPFSLFEECLKISKRNRKQFGDLLCLDLNDVYVSLAASEKHNMKACVIDGLRRDEETMDSVVIKLQNLISKHKFQGLIVGYHCTIKNENPYGEQVKGLLNGLCSSGKFEGLKYTYWDKRFESKHCEINNKIHYVHEDSYIDNLKWMSAKSLLSEYLDVMEMLFGFNRFDVQI